MVLKDFYNLVLVICGVQSYCKNGFKHGDVEKRVGLKEAHLTTSGPRCQPSRQLIFARCIGASLPAYSSRAKGAAIANICCSSGPLSLGRTVRCQSGCRECRQRTRPACTRSPEQPLRRIGRSTRPGLLLRRLPQLRSFMVVYIDIGLVHEKKSKGAQLAMVAMAFCR